MTILDVLRLIFGGIFLLFLPGFAWSFILFSRSNVDWIERTAISFGLSIAIVPSAVFFLNWVLGVPITLLNASLTVLVVTLVPATYLLATAPSLRKDLLDRAKNVPWLGSIASGSRLQDRLRCLFGSRKVGVIRRGLETASDFVLSAEPLWVSGAAALVFFAYLLELGAFLSWLALVLAFVPLPLRRIRGRSLNLRTPFDIPIAVYLVGALVGLITSPKLSLSLGAFQCILAAFLVYYSWVSYPRPAALMKWLVAVCLSAVLVQGIFASMEMGGTPGQPGYPECTYHGLALSLVIIACVGAGVIVFGRGTRTRLVVGLGCLALFVAVLVLVEESVPRLFAWESISDRLLRWEITVDLLKDSPFSGLGLGCWAFAYHGSEIIAHPTHVHNAYLELYANTGILGVVALALALFIGFKLALDIIRSPRNSRWYGFGIGVLLACLMTLFVGVMESAPAGVPLVREDTYLYIVSPAPFVLAILLVLARRLISTEDRW